MFNLIITVISIALVAGIVLAGLYYGGEAYRSASISADAATLQSQASQVMAADSIRRAESAGGGCWSLNQLVEAGYLSETPGLPRSGLGGWLMTKHSTGSPPRCSLYVNATNMANPDAPSEDYVRSLCREIEGIEESDAIPGSAPGLRESIPSGYCYESDTGSESSWRYKIGWRY